MIYNDRVVLIFETRPSDELFEKTGKRNSSPIPCMRNAMSNYEMMGLFGTFFVCFFNSVNQSGNNGPPH